MPATRGSTRLFYGFCWQEQVALWGDCNDWQDYLLVNRGETLQRSTFHLGGPESEWDHKRWALAQELGCSAFTHWCLDSWAPNVYAIGSVEFVAYQQPLPVGNIDPAWDGILAKFLVELGAVPPQEKPAWWIVTDYRKVYEPDPNKPASKFRYA
jgi:hypothetical protein